MQLVLGNIIIVIIIKIYNLLIHVNCKEMSTGPKIFKDIQAAINKHELRLDFHKKWIGRLKSYESIVKKNVTGVYENKKDLEVHLRDISRLFRNVEKVESRRKRNEAAIEENKSFNETTEFHSEINKEDIAQNKIAIKENERKLNALINQLKFLSDRNKARKAKQLELSKEHEKIKF